MPLDRQLRTLVQDRVDRTRVGRPTSAARSLMFASVVFVIGAVFWWGMMGGATRGRLYSPGHVSQAHARFENDCNVCHAGDGAGGFRRQVTDTACLACHDGALHHPNQKIAQAAAGVSAEARVLAVGDPSRSTDPAARAADCASCHTEHGGRDLLIARSDDHCLSCHRDLSTASASGLTKVRASVTAFNASDHPSFGTRLVGIDPHGVKRPIDPTVLKFNHRKHLTEVPALKGEHSCVACHSFGSPVAPTTAPTAPMADHEVVAVGPPFSRSATSSFATATDARYAMPVRYEQHCAGCHQLDVPGSRETLNEEKVTPVVSGLVVPHRSVGDVRAFLATRVMRELDRPEADFAVEDEDHTGPDFLKRQLWLHTNLRLYAENAGGTVDEDADPRQSTAGALADFMTANVVRTSANKCVKCHEVTGESPTKPGEAMTLETVPTGIPAAPRRWYPASRFDHRAHRDMSCVACHSGFATANLERVATLPADDPNVRALEETSFVHSPDMSWTGHIKLGTGTGSVARSCAECHHADRGETRGASHQCTTCHDFHDRSREQPVRPAGSK